VGFSASGAAACDGGANLWAILVAVMLVAVVMAFPSVAWRVTRRCQQRLKGSLPPLIRHLELAPVGSTRPILNCLVFGHAADTKEMLDVRGLGQTLTTYWIPLVLLVPAGGFEPGLN
jgi:hypothetical protein